MDKKLLFLGFFVIAGSGLCFLLIWSLFHILDYLTYETKAEKELWIAKDKVLIADVAHFFPATGTIVIEKNEACIPIRSVSDKEAVYTEILCENGRGWIIGSHEFKVIHPTEANLLDVSRGSARPVSGHHGVASP